MPSAALPVSSPPRLGFCCTFILDEPPGTHATLKAAKEATRAMNLTTVTMAHLAKLDPAARRAKLGDVVRHNLTVLSRQIAWVGARPPLERLLRMGSNILPGYTHLAVRALYAEPDLRAEVDRGLAEAGALARSLGVRLSFHPGPFCLLASRNPAAIENGLSELDYHAEVFGLMGYGGGGTRTAPTSTSMSGRATPASRGSARPCRGRAASPGTS